MTPLPNAAAGGWTAVMHFGAGLVAVMTLYAIWLSAYRFVARDTRSFHWWERPICALIAAILPAIIAVAAFVLGARL